ncbi:MAG: hypothetical protein J0H31_20155, partial [Alphaproteobacteria bacterium]|nr:hypothetical protein [Alphaproteobacteria bacterium]
MLSTLLRGLLSFLSVVAAIIIYQRGDFLPWLVAAFAVAGAAGLIVYTCAGAFPRVAALIVNGWYLMPFVLLVLSSLIVIYLSLNAAKLFNPAATAKEIEVFSAALIGAATAFLGTLWTEDITKNKGIFWPGELLKKAWAKTYDGHAGLDEPPPRTPAAQAAFAALYHDDDEWGPIARYKRARLISA